MRILSLFAVLSALFCFHPLASAQVPQQDPQALAVLSKMIAATGWMPANVPGDVVATGTVTRYRGDTSDTAAFTSKAKRPARMRTEMGNGGAVTIANGDAAASVSSSGTQMVPPHAAISMRPLTFPFYSDLVSAGGANVSLHYVGTETVGGQLAHRIEIARQPTASDPLATVRTRAGRLTAWVSASTWLPVQIESIRIANDNPTAARSSLRVFSDWRSVNGLAVPFHQEEFAGQQRLYALQVNSVAFNTGLSDSEFAIPAAQQ